MGEFGTHRARAVGKRDGHREHLGDEVPVPEPAAALRSPAGRNDLDTNAADVRLEPDRPLDCPGEARRRGVGHGSPEVLVEDAPELDAGLEQQRLSSGQGDPVLLRRSVAHLPPPASAGGGTFTVNGPTR